MLNYQQRQEKKITIFVPFSPLSFHLSFRTIISTCFLRRSFLDPLSRMKSIPTSYWPIVRLFAVFDYDGPAQTTSYISPNLKQIACEFRNYITRACKILLCNGTDMMSAWNRPLDSGAASSAACRQGKKDIGRSRKKKEKEKKGKKEEEVEDEDLIKGERMVEE